MSVHTETDFAAPRAAKRSMFEQVCRSVTNSFLSPPHLIGNTIIFIKNYIVSRSQCVEFHNVAGKQSILCSPYPIAKCGRERKLYPGRVDTSVQSSTFFAALGPSCN